MSKFFGDSYILTTQNTQNGWRVCNAQLDGVGNVVSRVAQINSAKARRLAYGYYRTEAEAEAVAAWLVGDGPMPVNLEPI